MPSSTLTRHSQPSVEIYVNIIEIAGRVEDHRKASHHDLDINTLVSKFFHALVTPILYSSIELATYETILKLERASKANPRLLRHTRSLLFTSGNLRLPAGWFAQAIAPGATELQRLCIA